MCNVIREGGNLQNGLNFYSLSDKGSAGFKYRKDDTVWMFRFSKHKNYTSFFQRFIYSKVEANDKQENVQNGNRSL